MKDGLLKLPASSDEPLQYAVSESPTGNGLTARPMIRVAIVEDNPDERLLLKRLLVRSRNLQCVGCYASGEDALKSLTILEAQVVLMDMRMPGLSGTACTRLLKKTLPAVTILMVTAFLELEALRESLLAGADGFLNKPLGETECCNAIHYALAGGLPLAKGMMAMVISLFSPCVAGCSLTARENAVLECMTKGLGNKEIAEKLCVSIHAVENSTRKMYRKLHVSNRVQAVTRWPANNR